MWHKYKIDTENKLDLLRQIVVENKQLKSTCPHEYLGIRCLVAATACLPTLVFMKPSRCLANNLLDLASNFFSYWLLNSSSLGKVGISNSSMILCDVIDGLGHVNWPPVPLSQQAHNGGH